ISRGAASPEASSLRDQRTDEPSLLITPSSWTVSHAGHRTGVRRTRPLASRGGAGSRRNGTRPSRLSRSRRCRGRNARRKAYAGESSQSGSSSRPSAPGGGEDSRVGQARRDAVLRREQRLGQWPGDGELRIVPGDGPLGLRGIELGALVEEVRRVAEDAESVRKTGGNPELPRGALAQLEADPGTEARRRPPHVDRDVPHHAPQDLDHLPLRLRLLEVQATERSPERAREIVLDERSVDARLRVAPGVEGLVEEAA